MGWEKVKSNAGACGVDGITVERFEKQAETRLLAVKEQLKRGTYHPQLIKGFLKAGVMEGLESWEAEESTP